MVAVTEAQATRIRRERRIRWTRGTLLPVLGVALAFGVWVVVYPYTRYLPGPTTVLREVVELGRQPETYTNILASLRRLAVGLGVGYLVALFVTLAMRTRQWWERFFSVYVFVTLTIPSLAAALFSMMIFGLSEVGTYAAVAVVIFPFVVLGLDDGFKSLDARLGDMARVYRFSWWQRLRHVSLPEMSPHLFAAFRNAHALGWKLVVVTEVFAQDDGIGYQYKRAFDFFLLDELVAWVFFFLAVVFAVEYGILRPIEYRVFRWRAARERS